MKRIIWLFIAGLASMWLIADVFINGTEEIIPALKSLLFKKLDEKGRLAVLLCVRLLMLLTPLFIGVFAFWKFFEKTKIAQKKSSP